MKIQNYSYLNQDFDITEQFQTLGNIHFIAQNLESFDPATGKGSLHYNRFERKNRLAFNMYSAPFAQTGSWSFPPAYEDAPSHPFSVEFVAENVLRIRTTSRFESLDTVKDEDSLMLCKKPAAIKVEPEIADEHHAVYRTSKMTVEIQYDPFHVIVRDPSGREITKTLHSSDSRCLQNYSPMPCSYVRSCVDMHRYNAFTLQIHPGEHFYGCGESFTKLDKLG